MTYHVIPTMKHTAATTPTAIPTLVVSAAALLEAEFKAIATTDVDGVLDGVVLSVGDTDAVADVETDRVGVDVVVNVTELDSTAVTDPDTDPDSELLGDTVDVTVLLSLSEGVCDSVAE